jgi:protocatechuate 3,4-dioxygenase alpha subunit
MHFPDEAAANAADSMLNLIQQEARRLTLVAERSARDGKAVYTFNIRLQGENETMFCDV